MTARLTNSHGFGLIELAVVIVIVGLLVAVAMQSATVIVQDARSVKTRREMETLTRAIVGDPSRLSNGQRSDFGYLGDIGAFPPNLQALYQNPGGFSTWHGPYLPPGLTQDSTGFKIDEWGTPYSYSGGVTITSTGSGSTITRKIADNVSDYTLNRLNGAVADADNAVPGNVYRDSVSIRITVPDGAGGTTTRSGTPDSAGTFSLDSLPAGTHSLRAIYTPNADTLLRYVTILPRHKSSFNLKFASAYFGGGAAATYILRPDGVGSVTDLTASGCTDNYQCVDETVSDGDGTVVERAAGTYQTDVYSLEDPPGSSGSITGVTVYCRARTTQLQGNLQPTVVIASIEYNGAEQSLTGSYVDYSATWTSNPNTGIAWTWTDIAYLEAGVRLKGQNSIWPAYCTQVWVEVEYSE